MKKRIFTGFIILAMILSLLTSCSKNDETVTSNTTTSAISDITVTSELYSAEDIDSSYDESSATKITLNGSSIAVDGSGAKAEGSVLTISSAGVYVLSGILTNGQILVSTPDTDKVRIVLKGVDITCATSAPIYASTADKLIITLVEGTQNSVTDGGSGFTYTDITAEEPNAAIFSKCDLSINGSGSLTVNAGFNNGIGTKDDLIIADGSFVINAENDGLRGRDSVLILDGSYQITAGGDGIQSNNDEDAQKGWILLESGTYDITSSNDGIQAETALSVLGGIYTITAGGGANGNTSSTESFKGLKSAADLEVTGGTLTIDSTDDSIHANGNIVISGGDFTLASGDDGIHADMDLTIQGGKINITKSYEGLEGATMTISDGTISIVSTDDAINAAGGDDSGAGGGFGMDFFQPAGSYYINISGGSISFMAGGDGIDSNGEINISGGTVIALINSTPDNGAIDCESTFTATGGTIIYGGTGMGNTPAGSSTQSYIFVDSGFSANAEITVKKDGKTLATAILGIKCQYLAVSTPDITNGESYEVYSGSSLISTITAGTGGISGGMGGGPGGGRRMP